MPLGGDLSAGFGTDDEGNSFNFLTSIGNVVTSIGQIGSTLGGDVDSDGITSSVDGVVARVDGADASGVTNSANDAAARATVDIASLPGADSVMRPVLSLVQTVETVTGGDVGALLTSLRQAADGGEAGRDVGVRATAASVGAVLRGLRAESPIGALIQRLLGLLPGGQTAGSAVDTIATAGAGAQTLIELIGGLMALRTCVEDIETAAGHVSGFLGAPAAREALVRARNAAGRAATTAQLVRDASTPLQETRAGDEALELVRAYRGLADVLIGGMAQAEATVVDANFAGIDAEIEIAKRSLMEPRGDALRDLTLDLQTRARSILPPAVGPEAASLDAFWDAATAMVTPLVNLVNSIPVDKITGPVAGAIGRVTGVVQELNRVLGQVQGAIRGVFEQARQLVAAIDVRAITEAIRRFLQPVVDAIGELERILTVALDAIKRAVEFITGKINDVKAALQTLATAVTGAFDRIAGIIDGIPIETMIEGLRNTINQAVDALHKVQLKPYFDTAIQIMDTTVTIIDAVPLELLPDQQKRELSNRVQPVLQVNFDLQVRQVLHDELTGIIDTLDEDILGEIQDAFTDVVNFLNSVNPRTLLTDFERNHFDPLLARLNGIDPDELLRPAADAIERVRERIAGLDLRGQVLGAIEGVFDDLLARFDQLNPAQLIVPIEQRVDEAKAKIIELVGLDKWIEHIDTLSNQATSWLDRIDLAAAAERLEEIHDQWLAAAQGAAGAVIGGIVASLVGSMGYRVRGSAYAPVSAWISGADGASEVRASLASSRARIEEARALAVELDLQAIAGELSAGHRALTSVVADLSSGSQLKLRLQGDLASVAPAVLFGAMAPNQRRYVGRLDETLTLLRAQEGSGFSQITSAGQTLREGLRPLAAIKDLLLSYLRRFGVDAVGKDVRQIIREVFSLLRPSRALAPLVPLVAAAREKVRTLLMDGLVTPVRAGVTEVRAVFDNIDLTPLREGLDALFTQVREEIQSFRPSVLLEDLLVAVESLQQRLVEFDPLDPIRETIQTFKDAVTDIGNAFRPTVLLASVLNTYDRILGIVANLDVRNLLGPVLEALRDIESQLDDGLEGTGEVFSRLQRVLRDVGGSGSASASVSVTT